MAYGALHVTSPLGISLHVTPWGIFTHHPLVICAFKCQFDSCRYHQAMLQAMLFEPKFLRIRVLYSQSYYIRTRQLLSDTWRHLANTH